MCSISEVIKHAQSRTPTFSVLLSVYKRKRDQRSRPDGGATHILSGRRPAVSAARRAVPQPGPGGRAGGLLGGPLHTVSLQQLLSFAHWFDSQV